MAQHVVERYRDWRIHVGRWPEPTWQAIHKDYDASFEDAEVGWVDNGLSADAETRSALLQEITAIEAEHPHFNQKPRQKQCPLASSDGPSEWVSSEIEPDGQGQRSGNANRQGGGSRKGGRRSEVLPSSDERRQRYVCSQSSDEKRVEKGLGAAASTLGPTFDCEPMIAGSDGWSEWIHPVPGYRMQCCDCGLVHDAEFQIVKREDDAPQNSGETDEGVIVFRMRRHGEPPIRPEEILPGMRYEGGKVDETAVLGARKRASRPIAGPALINPHAPLELSDGTPQTITVNHGDWFETNDGCFDKMGASLTGFHWRTPLRNVGVIR